MELKPQASNWIWTRVFVYHLVPMELKRQASLAVKCKKYLVDTRYPMVYYTVKLYMSHHSTVARYTVKGRGRRRQFSILSIRLTCKDWLQNCFCEKAHSVNAAAIFLWMASTPRRGDNLGSTSCAIHSVMRIHISTFCNFP